MQDVKQMLAWQLQASILKDWCLGKSRTCPGFRYDDSLCSHDGPVRFSTEVIERAFPSQARGKGCWKNGEMALYELALEVEGVVLRLAVSNKDLRARERDRLALLSKELGGTVNLGETTRLVQWEVAPQGCSQEDLTGDLERVFALDVSFFETQLAGWIDDPSKGIAKGLPDDDGWMVVERSELPDEVFLEGSLMTIISDRWERNKAARRACLAAHGTACAVCGFDFGRAYGSAFAGKIEVHHKVPLSEIRAGHVVDPVNDLVPLCPNCHMAIHSKPGGGTYTVDELRRMYTKVSPMTPASPVCPMAPSRPCHTTLSQLRPSSFAFRAAIFDFDGTLADSCDVWAQVDRDFFDARGLAYSPEYAETLALLGFEDGARYTVEAYGLAESPQEICDEWNRMGREHYTHDVQMFPDALEYVRALKRQGILTAIATTNDPQVVSSMEPRVPMAGLFDTRVHGCEVAHHTKEHPDIFLEAARRLGVEPHECVVFEDHLMAIRTAQAAGMACAGHVNGQATQPTDEIQAQAGVIIKSWSELLH